MSGTSIPQSQKHTHWPDASTGAQQLTNNVSPENAKLALTKAATKLKDHGGTLAIWNSNNTKTSDGQEAKFMRKFWVSSQRQQRTAEVVKNLFEKSSDRLDSPEQKIKFMADVTQYLTRGRAALRGDGLSNLVVQLEEMVEKQEPQAYIQRYQPPAPRAPSVKEAQEPPQSAHSSPQPPPEPAAAPQSSSARTTSVLEQSMDQSIHMLAASAASSPQNSPLPSLGQASLARSSEALNVANHYSAEVNQLVNSYAEPAPYEMAYEGQNEFGAEPGRQASNSYRSVDRQSYGLGSEDHRRYEDFEEGNFLDIDAWDKQQVQQPDDDDDQPRPKNAIDAAAEKARFQALEQQQKAHIDALHNQFDGDLTESLESIYQLGKDIVSAQHQVDGLMERIQIAKDEFDNTLASQQAWDKASQPLAQLQQDLANMAQGVNEHVEWIKLLTSNLQSSDLDASPFMPRIEDALEVLQSQADVINALQKQLQIQPPDPQAVMANLTKDSAAIRQGIQYTLDAAYQHLHTERFNQVWLAQQQAIRNRSDEGLAKANQMALTLVNGNDSLPSLKQLKSQVLDAQEQVKNHLQWLEARGFSDTSEEVRLTKQLAQYQSLEARIQSFEKNIQTLSMPAQSQRATAAVEQTNSQLAQLLNDKAPVLAAQDISTAFQNHEKVTQYFEAVLTLALGLEPEHSQRTALVGRIQQDPGFMAPLDQSLQQLQQTASAQIRELTEVADLFNQQARLDWQSRNGELQSAVSNAESEVIDAQNRYDSLLISQPEKHGAAVHLDLALKQLSQAQQQLEQHQNALQLADRSDQRSLETQLKQAEEARAMVQNQLAQLTAGVVMR
jgi:hypothetical protein